MGCSVGPKGAVFVLAPRIELALTSLSEIKQQNQERIRANLSNIRYYSNWHSLQILIYSLICNKVEQDQQIESCVVELVMINQGQSLSVRRTQRSSHYAVKGLVILLLMVGFFLYKFTYFMDFTHICIHDSVQEFLYPVNQWTDRDPVVTVILIGQLLIDGLTCTLFAYWLYRHHNIYLPNLVFVFFAIRAPFLNFCKLPFPDHYVWKATPIPSIMVPYGRTSDFFFSGHTGLVILLTVQLTRMKFPKWTLWICYFAIAYMPFMLISSRAHYTIDIIASPFFAHVAWHIHELYKKELDYLWSVPYVIVERINSRYFKEEETDNKLIDDNLS